MEGLRPTFPLSPVVVRSSVPSRVHFPCVPSLHGHYPLPGYYGRSDFLRSALRPAFGHEHRSQLRVGSSLLIPIVASNHSVSNHVMYALGLFSRHLGFFSPQCWFSASVFSTVSLSGAWASAQGFAFKLARSPITPHRIEFTLGASWASVVTDWSFASSCSPQSDYSAAVTFSFRPVDFCLTGTLTPLRQCFHSRASPRLTALLTNVDLASKHAVSWTGGQRKRIQLTILCSIV
jgi:hypothetical protein